MFLIFTIYAFCNVHVHVIMNVHIYVLLRSNFYEFAESSQFTIIKPCKYFSSYRVQFFLHMTSH